MTISLRHISAPAVLQNLRRTAGDEPAGRSVQSVQVIPRPHPEGGGIISEPVAEPNPSLRRNPFLSCLDEKDLSLLLESAEVVTFKKDSIIWNPAAGAKGVFFILRGSAKAEMCALIVRAFKLVVECLGPGDDIGLISFFDGQPGLASIISTSELHALSVPAEAMRTCLESRPSYYQVLFAEAGRRLRATEARLQAMI